MVCWNKNAVSTALDHLGAQQPLLLGYLTDILNRYHKWNRSTSYYDVLCGEWLMHFSHVVYSHYIGITHGGTCKTTQNPIAVFSDFYDYQFAMVGNSALNDQLREISTALLNGRSPKHHLLSGQTVNFSRPQKSLLAKLKWGIKSLGQKSVGNPNAQVLICQPYAKCLNTDWVKTMIRWRAWARQDDFEYSIDVSARIDSAWRYQSAASIKVGNYRELVFALLPIYVPALYLEGLSTYRAAAHALGLKRPAVAFTATSLHGHSLFKVLAADWRDDGMRIINRQHGGGYGIDRLHASEEYETRVADRFCTMGWRGNSPKQAPLKTPLSREQFQCTPVKGRILLTCIHYPKQVYRIHFQPMPGTIDTMIAETASFVGATAGWPELRVRSFPNDYGSGLVKILKAANPELHLDDMRVTGLHSYLQAELVAHSYLGTSWLETLALNIPTVCFYDPQTYDFREAVIPFIDRFESAGILHRDGAAAASFIGNIRKNPRSWWNSPDIQNLRREFVEQYANFSPDWAREWEQELSNWVH